MPEHAQIYLTGFSDTERSKIRELKSCRQLSEVVSRLLHEYLTKEYIKPEDELSKPTANASATGEGSQGKKLKTEAEIDAFINSRKTGTKNDVYLPSLRARLIKELTERGAALVKE